MYTKRYLYLRLVQPNSRQRLEMSRKKVKDYGKELRLKNNKFKKQKQGGHFENFSTLKDYFFFFPVFSFFFVWKYVNLQINSFL